MKKNQKELKTAQKIFIPHKKQLIRIKDDAVNPFGLYMFEHFLKVREIRPMYILYIHLRDSYMSFSCPKYPHMDTIRLTIDDKLWVEILYMFEVIEEKD